MRLYEINDPSPTQYWYHITNNNNLKSIMSTGLSPNKSNSSLNAIFLACDKNTAMNYEDHHMSVDKYSLLEIDGNGLDENLLGPDNYELQDILDNEDEDSPYYGLNWNDVSWEISAKLCCQVSYCGDISPKYIRVLK